MCKKAKLKDGVEVEIRSMKKDDLEKSFAFFQALPEEDRVFLRTDVTKRELVQQRTLSIDSGKVLRIIATIGDDIVADGVVELEGHSWKKHVGELRLFVAKAYQRKGLGILMAQELYSLAASARVEEIVVKMMRPQKAARSIFRKLGFHEEILMPDYVKDLSGKKQDLIIMRCDLDALWKELEDYFTDTDWQRTR